MLWFDYDQDTNVLYVHFEATPSSNHSEMCEDGIILDYREKTLVGLTILMRRDANGFCVKVSLSLCPPKTPFTTL